MKDILKQGSIVIVLGTGGVGKTTVAAALGIAGAEAGLDCALITVDPARRLRDALGMAKLGGSPIRLGRSHLRAAGLDPGIRLFAMMLDAKDVWDGIVERFASDPIARKRILENPFYQSLSAEFAGAEAFAALQQLYDLHQSAKFGLEVVDTPPAAHAFEFLEAPARFTRLLDSRTARWLFTPSLSAGWLAVKVASNAARFVMRELERFAGGNVLSTIAEFFAAAAETVDAVVDRLRKTEALMRSQAVRFVMVTTAEEDRLHQARDLLSEMKREKLHLSAIVINRFLDERTWREAAASPRGALAHLETIDRICETSLAAANRKSATALARELQEYRVRTIAQIARVARFASELPADVQLSIAPELNIGVPDLRALARIAGYITNGTDILRTLEAAAAPLAIK